MAKRILYHDNARRALERGMEIIVEAVSVTLGPKGRNVVLGKTYGAPQIVNDGDGTTTATVLAYAIVREESSKPIENLQSIAQVASISAGNDNEIGDMIAQAIDKVGKDGVISLEEGNSISTELEVTEGMEFEKDDIEKEALATVVLNKLRRILKVVVVRAPGFGDRRKQYLEDIAIMTGGELITEDAGLSLESVTLDLLGKARKIVITKDSTTIITEGTEEQVQKRCEQLRKQLNGTESSYEKEKIQDRIAKLSGGVAVIKVGAATETEMREKKLRLEDAINATKAAIEEGIVPGGGATLTHLSESLESW
eukprot:5567747-Lingulodinium_polyedra.AAC.1